VDVDAFIAHWAQAPIWERSHYQTFIIQLCRLIGVPAPDDERTGDLDYCFERPVRFRHDDGRATQGWIDCAKRGCFVLEAKQSSKRRNGGPLDPAVQLSLFLKPSARPRAPSPEAVDRVLRGAKRQAESYAKQKEAIEHLRKATECNPTDGAAYFRLGRLLRPKKEQADGTRKTARFYTIVSRDTVDADFAQNRQRFLAEQGYAYRIIDADDLDRLDV
jgi:hypothetical protein